MNFLTFALSLITLPLLGGVSAGVLEAGNSSEQSEGTPGGTLKVSVASDTGSLDLHSISHTNAEWLGRILYDNLVF
jgi:peptide/nickel transport system substrate-binding protein